MPPVTNKIIFIVLLIFLFSFQAQAQIFSDDLGSGPGTDLDVAGVVNIFGGLACWMIRFGIIAVSIAIVFYGILFLKSRGSPQGMVYAKKALTWGLVGALVIFGVFTIILSIAAIVGVDYPITSIINC